MTHFVRVKKSVNPLGMKLFRPGDVVRYKDLGVRRRTGDGRFVVQSHSWGDLKLKGLDGTFDPTMFERV